MCWHVHLYKWSCLMTPHLLIGPHILNKHPNICSQMSCPLALHMFHQHVVAPHICSLTPNMCSLTFHSSTFVHSLDHFTAKVFWPTHFRTFSAWGLGWLGSEPQLWPAPSLGRVWLSLGPRASGEPRPCCAEDWPGSGWLLG
jgi:hypothetical protein